MKRPLAGDGNIKGIVGSRLGSLPFTIHPPLAIIVTWVRAAEASAPTVEIAAVCHSSGHGAICHLGSGDS